MPHGAFVKCSLIIVTESNLSFWISLYSSKEVVSEDYGPCLMSYESAASTFPINLLSKIL